MIGKVVCLIRILIVILGLLLHIIIIQQTALQFLHSIIQITQLWTCYQIRVNQLQVEIPFCEGKDSLSTYFLTDFEKLILEAGRILTYCSVKVFCAFILYIEILAQTVSTIVKIYKGIGN